MISLLFKLDYQFLLIYSQLLLITTMKALYSLFQDPLENYFRLNMPIDVKQPPIELCKELTSKPKVKNFKNVCVRNMAKGKLNQLRTLAVLHWMLLYTEQDERIDHLQNILASIEQKTSKKQQSSVSSDIISTERVQKEERTSSHTANGNFFNSAIDVKSKNSRQQQILSAMLKKQSNALTDRIVVDNITQNSKVKKNIEDEFLTETFIIPYKKILRKTTSTQQMFKQVRQTYWLSHKLYHLFRSSRNLLYPQGEKKGTFLFNLIFYIRKMLTEIFDLGKKISTLGRYFLENETVKKTVVFFVDMLTLQAVYYYSALTSIFKSILTEDYQVCFKIGQENQKKARRQMVLSILTDYLPQINIEMRQLLQNKYFEPALNSKIYTKLMEVPQLELEILKKICEVLGYSSIVQQYNYIQSKHDLVFEPQQIFGTQMNLRKCVEKQKYLAKSQKQANIQRRKRCLTLGSQIEASTILNRIQSEKSAQNQFQAFIMKRYKFSARNLGQFVYKALDKAVAINAEIQRQKKFNRDPQSTLSQQKQRKITSLSITKNRRRFSNSNQRQQMNQFSRGSCNFDRSSKQSNNVLSKNQKSQQSFNLFSSPVKQKGNTKRKSKPSMITQLSDSIKLRKNNLISMAKYEIKKQLIIEELNTQLGDSGQITQELVLETDLDEV